MRGQDSEVEGKILVRQDFFFLKFKVPVRNPRVHIK